MKLYEIAGEVEALVRAAVDPETGEIEQDKLVALESLEMERDAKALAVAAYALGEEAEAEAVKSQAKRLTERARACEARAARLRDYLSRYLPPGHACRDDRITIAWRRSTGVVIDDPDALPMWCLRRREPEPDRSEIRRRLKRGEEVNGARLDDRQNLQIR